MDLTKLRFFYFTFVLYREEGSFYKSQFFEVPTFPPLPWVEQKIREREKEGSEIKSVFILGWQELSRTDWMTATGQVPVKVQPVKKQIIHSLK